MRSLPAFSRPAARRFRQLKITITRLLRSFGPRSQLLALALLVVWGGWYFESQQRYDIQETLGTAVQPEAKLMPDKKIPLPDGEMAPVYYRIPTEQPVVFLTIDDGHIKDQAGLAYMRQKRLVASLFLNDPEASKDYGYFKNFIESGSKVENHTISHQRLTRLSYELQKKDICDNADRFKEAFEERPKLFRPPYGEFSEATQQAARECGMKALIMWSASVNNGIVTYRRPGSGLQPGDIILLHFRPTMVQDLKGAEAEIAKAGLHVGLLEDWLEL